MHAQEQIRRKLRLSLLAMTAAGSLAASFAFSACQSVQGFTPTALIRVIDASYIAPAANVYVENQLIASDIGQGSVTQYGTIAPSTAATVKVTPTSGTTPAVTAAATLAAGTQHTVFIADNGASATQYAVTVLADQSTPAASGHSAFRFLNQAPRTGAVDIYMVPSGSTLADAKPLVTDLALGATTTYVSFASQTVNMVITPTGVTTSKTNFTYPLTLTGGEVRTVVVMDTQLTNNPPLSAIVADDLN